jgi:predicted nucleic acid-binding protein
MTTSGRGSGDTLEKNRLGNFDLRELIFVDANIFVDHASANPSYGKSCEEFLEKVESKNIVAITTTAVLDEVGYIQSLLEGARVLKTDELKIVRKKIKEDQKLAMTCYKKVREYLKYIFFLGERGLDIQKIELKEVLIATMVGGEYRLLFTDSLHLAVMKRLKIINIATRDSDFERVDWIKVWEP